MSYKHSRAARLALAVLGLSVFFALAAAMGTVAGFLGGARGTLAAVLLAGAAFGGCGLARFLRSRRVPGLTRPAPVRAPERSRDDLEPVNYAA